MKNQKQIERDYLDYLLTDTLPSEIPSIFSYSSFHSYLSQEKNKKALDKEISNMRKDYLSMKAMPPKYFIACFPYRFLVKKGSGGNRVISMIQPTAAMNLVLFNAVFQKEILDCFSDDSFSIRRPTKTSEVFYKARNGKTIEYSSDFGRENAGLFLEKTGSFYDLVPFHIVTDFFKSPLLKKAKANFRVHGYLDYQECFPSIYTHSFSWLFASEGHEGFHFKNKGFYGAIDSVCESINGQETHGIVVGPEFARTMAEILLENIDRAVAFDMLAKHGLRKGIDYLVFRYVDDQYLFAKNIKTMETLISTIEDKAKAFYLKPNIQKRIIHLYDGYEGKWIGDAKAVVSDLGKLITAPITFSNSAIVASDLASLRERLRDLVDGKEADSHRIISYVLTSFSKMVRGKNFRRVFVSSPFMTKEVLFELYSLAFEPLKHDICFSFCQNVCLIIYKTFMAASKSKGLASGQNISILQKAFDEISSLFKPSDSFEYFDLFFILASKGVVLPKELLDSLSDRFVLEQDPFGLASMLILFESGDRAVWAQNIHEIEKAVVDANSSFFANRHFDKAFDKKEIWFPLLFANCPYFSTKTTMELKHTLKRKVDPSRVAHEQLVINFLLDGNNFISWDFLASPKMGQWVFSTTKRTSFIKGDFWAS